MISVEPYRNLSHTLLALRQQAIESIPYCKSLVDGMHDPENIFYFLKSITTYKSDPKDRELIQTSETLFENNWHGSAGLGDCDCFTVLSLACLHVATDNQLYTILAGNGGKQPSHIWAAYERKGTLYDFDLTQPMFNTSRKYKCTQLLKTTL